MLQMTGGKTLCDEKGHFMGSIDENSGESIIVQEAEKKVDISIINISSESDTSDELPASTEEETIKRSNIVKRCR